MKVQWVRQELQTQEQSQMGLTGMWPPSVRASSTSVVLVDGPSGSLDSPTHEPRAWERSVAMGHIVFSGELLASAIPDGNSIKVSLCRDANPF